MRRPTIHLAVALLTFGLGISAWLLNPFGWVKPQPAEPLEIRIASTKVADEILVNEAGSLKLYYVEVIVRNVSDKTVAGYALAYEGPHGRGALLPYSERQILKPGEEQRQVISTANEKPRLWVDFVNFEGGSTWGPNQSYERDFVR